MPYKKLEKYYASKKKVTYKPSKFDILRFKHMVEFVKKKGKKKLNILDIGGEDTTFYRILKEKIDNFNYEVINISKTRVVSFRKQGIKAYSMDICGKVKIRKRYDYIIFGETIEHLPNPGAGLLNIKRLLKKGGTLIGSTPNDLSLRHVGKALFAVPIGHQGEHILSFNKTSLHSILQLAGFRNVKIYNSTGWIPFLKVPLPNNWLSEHLIFVCKN
jgi:2-polyprenyl-3-methyl-5-hydroxy-6-metoxy-1,4-benzoquinol methylase